MDTVTKYSTSNILGRDWIEVAWEILEHPPQQCQEYYRLADGFSLSEGKSVVKLLWTGCNTYR